MTRGSTDAAQLRSHGAAVLASFEVMSAPLDGRRTFDEDGFAVLLPYLSGTDFDEAIDPPRLAHSPLHDSYRCYAGSVRPTVARS